MYGTYSSTYGGGEASSNSSRLSDDPYLFSSSRYAKPNPLSSSSEITKYSSSSSLDFGSSLYSNSGGIGGQSSWSDPDGTGLAAGLKRSSEDDLNSSSLSEATDSRFLNDGIQKGSAACAFYMRTGTCRYGVTCKFDHPPPGEAVAMATAQGAGVSEAESEE